MELEELIRSIDIVEYISQYVELEQRGEEWWGLSPFTDEKTPSFSIRKEPPVFYDYSSGLGGNLYTFIKHYHKCSSRDAVEIIKKYAGCDGEITSQRTALSATIDCKKFAKPKYHTKQAKGTILPENYMERYEKKEEKLAVWEKEGISRECLDKFQVCYDGFSDRLVYPIRDIEGNIVNVGGRTLDSDWKEKKIRKYTYFFSWGTMATIYGLFENMEEIKQKKEVIIFEGCKSVLIAHTWGIYNTAALLTSHLNPNQMKILAKLGYRVVFALDKEVRIHDDHNIKKLKQYINVEYIWDRWNLIGEKDSPVDKGLEVFQKLYEQRIKYK